MSKFSLKASVLTYMQNFFFRNKMSLLLSLLTLFPLSNPFFLPPSKLSQPALLFSSPHILTTFFHNLNQPQPFSLSSLLLAIFFYSSYLLILLILLLFSSSNNIQTFLSSQYLFRLLFPNFCIPSASFRSFVPQYSILLLPFSPPSIPPPLHLLFFPHLPIIQPVSLFFSRKIQLLTSLLISFFHLTLYNLLLFH